MKKDSWSLIITGIIYLIIGLLFIIIPVSSLIRLTFILLGILMIICNIPTLLEDLETYKTDKKRRIGMIFTILCIILGFILIFWQNHILLFIVGAYLIAFPLYKVLIAIDKKKQLKLELPKIILGVIAIILGPENTLDVVFKVIGSIFILAGLIYIVCIVLIMTKYKDTRNIDEQNIIDENDVK